ncbi:MAG: VOC family protein [Roseovarius sp.]
MTEPKRFLGSLVTIELGIGDASQNRTWYTALLGREPDVVLSDTFFEWEIAPDTWLQLAERPNGAGQGGPVRIQVESIDTTLAMLRARLPGLEVERDFEQIPGILRVCNILDPSGNRVGLLEVREDA